MQNIKRLCSLKIENKRTMKVIMLQKARVTYHCDFLRSKLFNLSRSVLISSKKQMEDV